MANARLRRAADGGCTLALEGTGLASAGESSALAANALAERKPFREVMPASLATNRGRTFNGPGRGAQYKDMYRLCHLRGPAGILVALAEEL